MAFVVPIVLVGGSSPLTRGKPPPGQRRPHGRGLIPAHAGKTRKRTRPPRRPRAHPRSRGENQDENIINLSKQGSSPLTRGKRLETENVAGARGLIPAHAGKTRRRRRARRPSRAHPRSRGENLWRPRRGPRRRGSSPLTRGKQLPGRVERPHAGLIPAHAGKTVFSVIVGLLSWAHPRSRGENLFRLTLARPLKGSSPLTRGKLVCLPGED